MRKIELLKRTLNALTVGGLPNRQSPASHRGDAEALFAKEAKWLDGEGIQGLGIAHRITQGERQNELSLKVYVDRKLRKDQLTEPMVPDTVEVPALGLSVETDVEAIGVVQGQNFNQHARPLFRGLSINTPGNGLGTLGCFVRKRNDPDSIYLLSNAHVLGIDSTKSSIVFQPDDRLQENLIADYAEGIPIDFNGDRYPNQVDAAIARLRPGIEIDAVTIKGISKRPRMGTPVELRGAISGTERGFITDTYARMKFNYPTQNKSAGFQNLIKTEKISSEGDSGSILLHRRDRRALGLLIGGSDSASFFTPIMLVLNALNIQLLTSDQRLITPAHSEPEPPASPWLAALQSAQTTGQHDQGVAGSHHDAEVDLGRAEGFKSLFTQVGTEFDIPASVLAALASRESRVGNALDSRGYGDNGNGFGIMQVDIRHHNVEGLSDPKGISHLRQAARIFADYRSVVANKHRDWDKSNVLKGAMVAYNSGPKNVQTIAAMDVGTTNNDYGSDVTARAQFYAARGF